MTDAELHFPGPDGGVHTTMLSADADGNTVTRFSYDLLTAADDDPLGEAGRRLAHRINDVFREGAHESGDPGRLAPDLGQPAHVARAAEAPRSQVSSDRVLEHRLAAGVTSNRTA